jgi:hypothetical protein
MLSSLLLMIPKAQSRVDIGVFICALILAPILTGAALFFLVVPIFAVPTGAIPYLLCGTPAYWLTLRGLDDPDGCVGPVVRAGLTANLGSIPFFALMMGIGTGRGDTAAFVSMVMLGFVFAALWSLVFGWIYRKFAKRHLPHVPAEIFE